MTRGRQLHLNVNLLHSSVYPSAWRLPNSRPGAFVEIEHFVRVARIAERAKFDAIILADTPAINDRIDDRPFNALEPTIVLASVAAATSHVGLIATASTSYNEPFNLARRLASLDLVNGAAPAGASSPPPIPRRAAIPAAMAPPSMAGAMLAPASSPRSCTSPAKAGRTMPW